MITESMQRTDQICEEEKYNKTMYVDYQYEYCTYMSIRAGCIEP